MKKNFTYLKALFLVMLLVAGSGAVWGHQNPEPLTSNHGLLYEFQGCSGYPTF